MKIHLWMLCAVSVLVWGSPALAEGPAAGVWDGSINIPGIALGFSVTLGRSGDAWTGTIDIPAQGTTGVSLGNVTVSGSDVSFALLSVPGTPVFKGTSSADGKSISGTFTQNGASFPIKMDWKSAANATPAAVPALVDGGKLEGIWIGTVPVGGSPIRLVFHVTKAANGSIAATFSSPDQGSPDFPVTGIAFSNSTLHFDVPGLQGFYDGKLSADGMTIDGSFTQGITQPLSMKKSDRVALPNRPQEPKPPFPYDAIEVSYRNVNAGINLAGTLTLPRGASPFPAVILITGSGPQDRDETLFGHKPFLVLADYLTRRGIGVLRVDDRGVGGSTGDDETATTVDFAGDVLSGIAFLRSRKEIDARRIGLIGHSEGGIIAPMVASQSNDVAFIVLLAGTGLTGEEILYAQAALIAKSAGAGAAEISAQRAVQESYYAVLKSGGDLPSMEKKLRELGNPDPSAILSPWFRFFLTYDPRPALMKTTCPVLSLNGEHDLQVPPHENLAAIEGALKMGGNKDYKTVLLPNLNHLFQTSTTGSPGEYGSIEETLSPIVLTQIGDWIAKHTAKA